MKKSKLDTNPGISADTFSGVRGYADDFAAISSIKAADISRIEREVDTVGDEKPHAGLLRQIFLYFPGTFLLFFASYGAGIKFMELAVFGRELQNLPDDYLLQFAFIGSTILVSSLMTWAGLGDIRNKKHFAISASLLVTGAIFGAAAKAAASISDLADKMLDDFNYLIYLLPLALVIPILAKNLVERETEKSAASEQ
jgi:hypothetical protein